MNWLYFSIIAGVGFGLQTSILKYASGFLPKQLILACLFLGASIFLLPRFLDSFVIISFYPFFIALIISLVINILAFQLLTTALQLAPLTIVIPFLNLTPLFLFFNGWIILGETVTQINAFAILLVISGCLIIQIPVWKKDVSSAKASKKGIVLALGVSFLWSISAAYEKVAVLNSSVFSYAFLIHLLLGSYFWFKYLKSNRLRNVAYSKKSKIMLLLLGLVTALMAYSQYTALTLTSVSTVIAIKRAGVLVSTLIGFFYFKGFYWNLCE